MRAWRDRSAFAALSLYLLIAFLYVAVPFLLDRSGGLRIVGVNPDAEIFVWSLGWWPHAILHGENPFFTHAIWAPVGVNMTWTTTVPGLALLFAPVTLLAGPLTAYDVAAVVMPAASAWTAFVLCRQLTRAWWPSVVGGYLFGFSTFLIYHTINAQLNLSAAFLLPLVPLIVLRYLEGTLGGRAVVLRLAPLLGLELLISTEVSLTLLLVLALGVAIALTVMPEHRPSLYRLIPYVVLSYGIAALVTAPFVYYLLTGFQRHAYWDPNTAVADLRNIALPPGFSPSISGLTSRQQEYLGLPALVLVGLFLRGSTGSHGRRFVLAALSVSLIGELGAHLVVAGHRSIALPWSLLQPVPPFNNIQPVRFALYTSLLVASVAAVWAARRQRTARVALPVLAALAVYTTIDPTSYRPTFRVPTFFTSKRYRSCLRPGETILPLPIGTHGSMLWQALDGYRFRMAGGFIGPYIPPPFLGTPAMAAVSGGAHLGPAQSADIRQYIAANHVTTVVVDDDERDFFAGALNRLATPHPVGGVVLYRFEASPPRCP